MLWAILGTIIGSITRVLFKKTTYYKLSTEHNELIGLFGGFLGIGILYLLGLFDLGLKSPLDYVIIISIILFFHPVLYIRMFVLQREKLSSLVPYQNISPILTVLLAFLFLGDSISTVSFFIFLVIISILFYTSTKGNKLVFNKNIGLFIIGEIITAIYNISVAYILIGNTTSTYFIVYILLCFLIYSIITFSQFIIGRPYPILDKTFYTYRLLASLGWTSWLIGIILISEYGIIVTTLLGFLGLIVTLSSSYFVYRDIPSKKDLIITISISILVALGFLFR
ncbi:hypothetical protein LAT59_01040 [Candidatus Gracilibacteria bacterium]|nr:hypothetical protein [Candidatus Gracilibacteria bacterium]